MFQIAPPKDSIDNIIVAFGGAALNSEENLLIFHGHYPKNNDNNLKSNIELIFFFLKR